jgi:PEP-CTERM motif
MRIRIFLLVLAVSFVALVPAASATSVGYSLSCGGTTCGSVTISNLSGNKVQVSVSMSGGYSIQAKANSGGFLFNTISGLNLHLSGFSTTEFGNGSAKLNAGVNNGAGSFTWGVVKFNIPHGNTSVSGLSFVISGMQVADLLANNKGNVVSVHYCSPGAGGASSTKCPGPTGFATSGGSTVPEPGTLSMLGTGLIGLAGLLRRRFVS